MQHSWSRLKKFDAQGGPSLRGSQQLFKYTDQGYPDRGYQDQGYPDWGYPDHAYPDQEYPHQETSPIIPRHEMYTLSKVEVLFSPSRSWTKAQSLVLFTQ